MKNEIEVDDNSFIGSKEIFDTLTCPHLLFIFDVVTSQNCFVLWQVGFNFKKL